jgi:hypothetical protein
MIGDVCALDCCGVMVGWTTDQRIQWSPGILTSSVVRSTLTASKTGLFRSYYEKNEVMMPVDDASCLSALLGLGVEDIGAKKRQHNVSSCTLLSKFQDYTRRLCTRTPNHNSVRQDTMLLLDCLANTTNPWIQGNPIGDMAHLPRALAK